MRMSLTSRPNTRWRSPITGGFDLVPKLSEASVLVSDKVSRWPRGVWQVRHAGVQAYRGVCLLCTHKLSGPFRPQSLVGANLFLNSEFFAPDASHNGRLRPALHLPLRGAKRMLTT